jgi:hypothetical protein
MDTARRATKRDTHNHTQGQYTMARRSGTVEQWDRLSPAYKQRLANAGYTLEDYLAGTSRKAARGHATTPEKPARVRGHEHEYPEYMERVKFRGISRAQRQALADKINRQVRMDQSVKRFDIDEIETHIYNMNARTFTLAQGLTWEEWRDLARIAAGRISEEERQAILAGWEYSYYDSEAEVYINPFWYH